MLLDWILVFLGLHKYLQIFLCMVIYPLSDLNCHFGKEFNVFGHFRYISALPFSSTLVRYHQHSPTLDQINLVQSCSYMQFLSFMYSKNISKKRKCIQIYTGAKSKAKMSGKHNKLI